MKLNCRLSMLTQTHLSPVTRLTQYIVSIYIPPSPIYFLFLYVLFRYLSPLSFSNKLSLFWIINIMSINLYPLHYVILLSTPDFYPLTSCLCRLGSGSSHESTACGRHGTASVPCIAMVITLSLLFILVFVISHQWTCF